MMFLQRLVVAIPLVFGGVFMKTALQKQIGGKSKDTTNEQRKEKLQKRQFLE